MTDPFDRLHRPLGRTDPDPGFAARLLARVEDAFGAPPGAADRAASAGDVHVVADGPAEAIFELKETDTMETLQHARRRRWRAGVVAAAALTVTVGLLAFVRSGPDPAVTDTIDAPPTSSTAASMTVPAAEPGPAPSVAGAEVASSPPVQGFAEAGATSFTLSGFPDHLAVSETAVWVERPNRPIEAFDPVSFASSATAAQPVADALARPAVGFGSIWIPDAQAASIARVDANTGAAQGSIAVPGGFALGGNGFMADLAVAPDGIWAVAASPRQLIRIDPTTDSIEQTLDLPADHLSLAYGAGSLWLTRLGATGSGGGGGPVLERIDPTTGAPLATVPLGFRPGRVAVGESGVWVLSGPPAAQATVAHIDPATNTVRAELRPGGPLEGLNHDLAVADGAVWLSGLTDALLVRIDPVTDQVVARYGPDALGGGLVAVGHGHVWVTDPSANVVHRLAF